MQMSKVKKTKAVLTYLPAAAIVCSAVVLIGVLIFAIWRAHTPPAAMATVTEVAENEVPADIAASIHQDALTPGFYEYEAGADTYVMLTFGEVSGIALNVTPNIDGTSVYFAASGTDVSDMDVAAEYRVFRTDATAISADEQALKNPYYGVGSAGMNIGWVSPTENGAFYITPLMDTSPTDRVFISSTGVPLSSGVYYYEYDIQSAGAYITAAEPMDEYELWAHIDRFDDEAMTADLLIGEEQVRFTVSTARMDDDAMALLREAEESDFNTRLTIGCVSTSPAITGIGGLVIDAPAPEGEAGAEADDTTGSADKDGGNEDSAGQDSAGTKS